MELLDNLEKKLAPENAALLVVDVQNDYCAEGGYAHKRGDDLTPIHNMVPRLEFLIEKARAAGVPVIFVQSVHGEEFLMDNMLEKYIKRGIVPTHCKAGSWGADFFRVKPQTGENVIIKHWHSAFEGTGLPQVLKKRGRRSLVMCGVFTNVCVQATAWQAYAQGHYLVFASDCLVATSPEQQENTLNNFKRTLGNVETNETIAGIWDKFPV